MYGDWGNDTLEGGAGGDLLNGGGGADTASYARSSTGVAVDLSTGTASGGDADGDTLRSVEGIIGSQHADTLTGGDGDDTLTGGDGHDRMDGGAGDDWLWYGDSDAGVNVNLSTGAGSGGHAEGDTFSNVEGIGGSEHGDRLTGDAGNNHLRGNAGSDEFVGGAGADTLDGGDGGDSTAYSNSDAGVTIDLAAGTAQGGHADGDTLTGIEHLSGSRHADHLTGDDGYNRLFGQDGDDTLNGGAGGDFLRGGAGADMLDGGDGRDTVSYSTSHAGVTVNSATGTVQGGHADGDTLTGTENVRGSDHADRLIGDDGNNSFESWGGADTLDGGDGDDYANYSNSDAGVTIDLAAGTAQGGHARGRHADQDREPHGFAPRRPPGQATMGAITSVAGTVMTPWTAAAVKTG